MAPSSAPPKRPSREPVLVDLALQGERMAMTAAVKLAAFDRGEAANAVALLAISL